MTNPSMEAGAVSDLAAENRELRAYLKAFCAATVDPEECGRDVGVHEANPFIEWEFGLVDEGTKPGRVITGGQVRRAMELVGYDKLKIEPTERTIAEELTEARDLRREVKQLRRLKREFEPVVEALRCTVAALDEAAIVEMPRSDACAVLTDALRDVVKQADVTLALTKGGAR